MELRIASRGSKLSLAQVEEVMGYLKNVIDSVKYKIVIVKTRGDVVLDKPLYEIGGKGLFEKEVNKAVLEGRADIAVHSMKDLPTRIHDDLEIALVPPRLDPRDSLIPKPPGGTIEGIPPNSIVGTSSLRRIALLKYYNKGIVIRDIRGNIDTRLRKLTEGRYDYLVLAEAGLRRLSIGLDRSPLPIERFPPAPGQGLLAVVAIKGSRIAKLLRKYSDKVSHSSAIAERAFLRYSGAGCNTPVGGITLSKGNGLLKFIGVVLSRDGSRAYWIHGEGDLSRPEELGKRVGEEAYSVIDRVAL